MSQKSDGIEEGIILILDTILTIMKNYQKFKKVVRKQLLKKAARGSPTLQ